MPSSLPNTMVSLVIGQWLQGIPRDMIAAENSMSAGAVTSIINKWRQNLGIPLANDLRELAVTLRKIGINANQCAMGFRVGMMMLRLGVKEDEFQSFISNVYNRCKNLGVSPENVASFLKDLIEFSKTTIVSLTQISVHIRQKANQKRVLEVDIQKYNAQIEELAFEQIRSTERRESA